MLPMRVVVFVAAILPGSFQAADAQTPPATPAPSKLAPAAPAAAGKTPVAGKRATCREDAKAKKLKGMDLTDSLQLCMAEARVSCVKEAIAKKMPIGERTGFFKTCINE